MEILKEFRRNENIEQLGVDELLDEFLKCFAWDLKLREATTSKNATVFHPKETKLIGEQTKRNNAHLNKILDYLAIKCKGDFSWVKKLFNNGNIDVKIWLGGLLVDHYPQEALGRFCELLASPDVDISYHDALRGLIKYLGIQQAQ